MDTLSGTVLCCTILGSYGIFCMQSRIRENLPRCNSGVNQAYQRRICPPPCISTGLKDCPKAVLGYIILI